MATGGAAARGALFVLPLALALAAYGPTLGHDLVGEDLALARQAEQESLGAIFAPRAGGGPSGSNPYWRPFWLLLAKGASRLAPDSEALARIAHAQAVAIHAVGVVLVHALARRFLGGRFAPAAAAALFATAAAPSDAVAWYGASNKTLGAVFALGAVGALDDYARRGGGLPLARAGVLGAFALATNELAYALFPLAVLLPLARAEARAGARAAAAGAILGALAFVQLYGFQPPGARARGHLDLPLGDLVARALRHEAGFLAIHFGLPADPPLLFSLVAAAGLGAVCLLGGGTTRFLVAWWLLAPFPTLLDGVARFHAYAAAAPAAILAAAGLRALAGNSGLRRALASAVAAGIVAVSILAVRTQSARWGAHAGEVRSFDEALSETAAELDPGDLLTLVNVPASFDGALVARERFARATVRRVDFLETDGLAFLPRNFSSPDPTARRELVLARRADGGTEVRSAADLAGGRERAGGAWIFYDAVAVREASEAASILRSAGVDPARTLVLETRSAPPRISRAPERAELLSFSLGSPARPAHEVTIRVEALEAGFVLLADPSVTFSPDPFRELLDREAYRAPPRAEAWVDGESVAALRAHFLYRAVPVSAGSHEIRFRYSL